MKMLYYGTDRRSSIKTKIWGVIKDACFVGLPYALAVLFVTWLMRIWM
jgi:hypothetical protein